MRIGTREFDVENRTYVMGILNVTPDSFSDGGYFYGLDDALKHTEAMLAEGADIIDVGGESTRPGYTLITEQEEIERIVPVIEAIKKRFDVPVSIDTYKAAVAKAAVEAGADLVNDIWGLKHEAKMAEVIAESKAACCLMHNRNNAVYSCFMEDMKKDLCETIELAGKAGIARDRIILDPGVGFAKSYENNLEAIRCMGQLKELGFPILLGTSRKSVIGLTLDLTVTERLEGTLVTTVMAVEQGVAFVRVHDVEANVRAIKMAEAIRGK